MSRSTRHDRPMTPVKPYKHTVKQALEKLRREMKRRFIKDGLIVDPSKRGPSHKWTYNVREGCDPGVYAVVYADTRSQAKALIKKELGIPAGKRLPSNVEITGVPLDATTT